jgi:hypothetical protein
MLIAIAAVLVGIFFTATGRGGELAVEQADHAPLDLGPVSAADIALLRPPSAMWGYNMQVTDAALDQIARAMRERDVTIAYLQDQLASGQRNGSYAEPRGAHARPLAGFPQAPDELGYAGDRGVLALSESPEALEPLGGPAFLEAQDSLEAPEDLADSEDLADPEDLASPEALEPSGASGFRAPEPWAYEAFRPSSPHEYEAHEPHDYEAPQTPEPSDYEAPRAAETPAAEAPATETPAPAERHAAAPTAPYRQTPLVLKASGPKPPPPPEPHEITQPSVIREVTQPPEIHDPTEASATLTPEAPETPKTSETPQAPNEVPFPQASFDTHDWWAEQQEAAEKERARRRAAGETGEETEEEGAGADPLAAEEQGW